MTEKFDPAPQDKHAEKQADATQADKAIKTNLGEGLVETFPASDPVNSAQLGKSKPDAKDGGGDKQRTTCSTKRKPHAQALATLLLGPCF